MCGPMGCMPKDPETPPCPTCGPSNVHWDGRPGYRRWFCKTCGEVVTPVSNREASEMIVEEELNEADYIPSREEDPGWWFDRERKERGEEEACERSYHNATREYVEEREKLARHGVEYK